MTSEGAGSRPREAYGSTSTFGFLGSSSSVVCWSR